MTTRRSLLAGALAAIGVAAACAGGSSSSATSMSPGPSTLPAPDMSAPVVRAPSPDPRVGLKAGLQDAGEAIWNLRKVSHTPSPAHFAGITNSDLAFSGTDVIQGNYNGFQIWDVSDPTHPVLRDATLCPASQSDVSVYKNLLFVSAEAPTARLDCGANAPRETVSRDRIRGVRIFDISDIDHPKYLANVQTCRGSHTHTVVNDPNDQDNVYIYISGTSSVRPSAELPGCIADATDPNTSLFRIEVIKVPLAHPEQAAIVSSPRIFADAANPMGLTNRLGHGASPADTGANGRGGRGGRGGGGRGRGRGLAPNATAADSAQFNFNIALASVTQLGVSASKTDSSRYDKSVDSLARAFGVARPPRPAPRGALTQCHDITAYPAVGLAGGACAGMGLLLDIHDTPHPRRIAAVADSNFSFWHSATFSNDGSMVLFSDEWGGGGAAYCRKDDPKNWGADAIFKIVNGQMVFQAYYKMPAPQTQLENCVAHNGSLIPIPGRTVMVQAWYQGGLSMFEWTDPAHP
ncbi:MAG: LVIVD repeat-containing protein, partial [Gemmatimonadaceae bacterium]